MAIETIGFGGGGQLGRMMTEDALRLGFEVEVVDPTPNCPAAQVGAKQLQAALTNGYALREVARRVDVFSWEIEHINAESLLDVPNVQPSPESLEIIQDKHTQKAYLHMNGIPVADFRPIATPEYFERLADDFLHPGAVILKTRQGGFDGRGNHVPTSFTWADLPDKYKNQPIYAETRVPLQKELAVLVVRDISGHMEHYPVVETIHKDSICHMVLSPPEISPTVEAAAIEVARATIGIFEGAGVHAVELFLTEDDQVLVNEVAPRVHNSGHLTREANVTGQFEQHIRAITGLPLGSTDRTVEAAVMINILGEREGSVEIRGLERVLKLPGVKIELYGKSPTRPERKMGHITVTAADLEIARAIAIQARKEFSI